MSESDQVLVLDADGSGYKAYPLLVLLGVDVRRWRSARGFGLSPLHFLTQRGPFQDGESILDMRFDTRTIQIGISERCCSRSNLWDRRWDLLDLLRPNRSFNGVVQPLIYRKWLPSGKIESGNDLVTTLNSAIVTSHDGRFIDRGGLDVGAQFTITSGADAGTYVIVAVPNDYTLTLSANMAATATDVGWQYTRSWAKRDLYCLLEQGPTFDEGPGPQPAYPTGYYEALRFVAHDPMWYGLDQVETWEMPTGIGALVFDGVGAYFELVAGPLGEWLFWTGALYETIDVVYWGTASAKPTIAITGPATYPAVENTTTGTRIEIDYAVGPGDVVTIDTLALTVTNAAGTNLVPYMSGDLATFSLEPAPQAPNRINSVLIEFTDGTWGVSGATLTWRNRLIGI